MLCVDILVFVCVWDVFGFWWVATVSYQLPKSKLSFKLASFHGHFALHPLQ